MVGMSTAPMEQGVAMGSQPSPLQCSAAAGRGGAWSAMAQRHDRACSTGPRIPVPGGWRHPRRVRVAREHTPYQAWAVVLQQSSSHFTLPPLLGMVSSPSPQPHSPSHLAHNVWPHWRNAPFLPSKWVSLAWHKAAGWAGWLHWVPPDLASLLELIAMGPLRREEKASVCGSTRTQQHK